MDHTLCTKGSDKLVNETLEIPALMKLIILWGIQAIFIQEIFIECLVCAQQSSSYKQSSYGAYNAGFKNTE